MFAAKSTLFLVFFAISARLAFAVPPACLLAAVNTQSDPADLPALCGTDSSKVQDQIKELCGDNVEAALNAYKDVCKAAGKSVSTESSSHKSSSSHASKTSSSSHASKTSESTSESTTQSTSSATASETSAPYPVTYTSTYYDTECSCTKTTAVGSTGVIGSSGFVSATGGAASTGFAAPSGSSGIGSGSSATGSPILPSGTKPPGLSSTPSSFTGAASKNIGFFGAGILAVAGFALTL